MQNDRVMLMSVLVVLVVVLLTAVLALSRSQSLVTQQAITALLGMVGITVVGILAYIARTNGDTEHPPKG